MFPLKPGAHIQVDVFVFTDMLARGQARGFGQWKPRLMFFPTIMPHNHWVHGTKLACNIHIGIKFRQKTVQRCTKFFHNSFLPKQPGNISMKVALHMLVPFGHGTQCCTALRLAMVFSVMFFTKTEPGWHCAHPMPSLRL